MAKIYTVLITLLAAIMLLAACEKIMPPTPLDDQILDGPVSGLTGEQLKRFAAGDAAFNNQVFTPATGLGPVFVATSCGSCHAGDGKGHAFTMLTRFGQKDSTGNQYLHLKGPQLQHRAIPGCNPEVLPAGAPFSKFMPPANTGLGFIEIVPDAAILALADPNDADADGISGRPNWVTLPAYVQPRPTAIVQNSRHIGRFGKKGPVYSLLQQTANAYNQDMGITSVYEPYDTYTGDEVDPELPTQTLLDVVFYLQTLKVPVQRDASNPEVMAGKAIFIQTGCAKCHVPQLQTGFSPIDALSNKTIYPYTDLLLHDMGPGLDDGYTEGSALTAEWRTPALWGLGLSKNSQGGQYFLLHDGRAHTLSDAILLHGGEAQNSRDAFNALSETEKQQLIKFLESL